MQGRESIKGCSAWRQNALFLAIANSIICTNGGASRIGSPAPSRHVIISLAPPNGLYRDPPQKAHLGKVHDELSTPSRAW